MKRPLLTALTLTTFAIAPAYANEWRVGPSISAVTGIDEVADIYERN